MHMADPATGLVSKDVLCQQPELVLNPFIPRLIDVMLNPPEPSSPSEASTVRSSSSPRPVISPRYVKQPLQCCLLYLDHYLPRWLISYSFWGGWCAQ